MGGSTADTLSKVWDLSASSELGSSVVQQLASRRVSAVGHASVALTTENLERHNQLLDNADAREGRSCDCEDVCHPALGLTEDNSRLLTHWYRDFSPHPSMSVSCMHRILQDGSHGRQHGGHFIKSLGSIGIL
mmetsp:Transcript_70869/g.190828  ORF Transcript_70869/g.190828 Transcript_70869/m.190828 type:complete len:133 (-) Transcript_70869:130-528(-)